MRCTGRRGVLSGCLILSLCLSAFPAGASEDDAAADDAAADDEQAPARPTEIAPGTSQVDRRSRRVPGAWGDPMRSLATRPGVAQSFGGLTGELALRGAGPEDTRLFIDGHEAPLLFHLAGLKSLLHPELLEAVRLTPGGFSARHGRATGGIVELELRETVPAAWRWHLHADLLDAGVLVRAPVAGGVVAAAVRRSYADLILTPIGLGVPLPYYLDYQLKGDFAAAGGAASVLVFGVDDGLANLNAEDKLDEVDPALLQSGFHRLQLRWRRPLTPGHGFSISGMLGVEDGLAAGSAAADPTRVFGLRADYAGRVARWLTLRAGVDLRSRFQSADQTLLVGEDTSPLEPGSLQLGSAPTSVTNVGGYLETEIEPRDGLQIVPGLRLDRFGAVGETVVDPRLAAAYRVAGATTLRASGGIYHQPPRVGLLGAFVTDLDALGVAAPPEEALHLAAGVDQRVAQLFELSVTGYVRQFDAVVEAYPLEVLASEALVPVEGEGRAAGVEVFARLLPHPRWFGWVGYTFSTSTRREPGGDWFPSGYDQSHQAALVASYRLLETVRIGTRARFASGVPFTPFVGSVYDADTRRAYGIRGERNSERTESFFQVDLRIDKIFRGDAWSIVLYADVMNVTNQVNRNIPDYNFDFTQQRYVPSLPVFPMIGVEAFR